jgi:type II secretory pathway component PulF
MAEFRYRAVDKLNQPVEGTFRAETATDVVRQLAAQGLQVTSVEPLTPARSAVSRTRLSAEDLSLFNEQLSALVKSGLPLAPSLEVLARDVRSARLRRVVDRVRTELEAGHSLSESLEREPVAFSPVYVSVVRAGEQAGNLSAALEALAAHSERNLELRYRLQEAIAYPILVVVLALTVLIYFSVRMAPVLDLGGEISNGEYPFFTSIILALSTALYHNWLGITVGLVALVVALPIAWRLLRATPGGRFFLSRFGLLIPGYGHLLRETAVARFSQALSILLAARVPVPESLRLAGVASGNALLEQKSIGMARDVQSGRPLSNAFEEAEFFPETYCWLVRTGETRGDLDRVVAELAESHEQAANRRSRVLASTAGPAFTVMAAVVVVMAMLSAYRPLIASMWGV